MSADHPYETDAGPIEPSSGEIAHAELRWPGGGGIMLGSHRDHGTGWAPGTGYVYVVAQDVDALHDEDYGSRGFTARDPEGVFWSFGTYGGVASSD